MPMKYTPVLGLTLALVIAFSSTGCATRGRSTDADALRANKAVVTTFLNTLANDRDVEKALGLMGDGYIQHNPGMPTGKDASRVAFKALIASMAYSRIEIKRVIAEGDLVLTHSRGLRYEGDRGIALMDLFRIEGGKIVEHWDVIQEIPDPAQAKNPNSMF